MVRINWTKQAVTDLKNIYEFIASDSKYYAKREVIKLRLKTEYVKKYINIGRVVPEFMNEDIRELIECNYRIVYKILSDQEVDILPVHHSSRKDLQIPQ